MYLHLQYRQGKRFGLHPAGERREEERRGGEKRERIEMTRGGGERRGGEERSWRGAGPLRNWPSEDLIGSCL